MLAPSPLYGESPNLSQSTVMRQSATTTLDTTTRQEHIRRSFQFWQQLSAFYQTPALRCFAAAVESEIDSEEVRLGTSVPVTVLFGQVSRYPGGLRLLQDFFDAAQEYQHRDLLFRILVKAEVVVETSDLLGALPLSYLSRLEKTGETADRISSLNLEEFATWLRAALIMPSPSEHYLLEPMRTFLESLVHKETFRLLTYNVGGMPPWFSPWQPLRRIAYPQVARALSGSADVALLQETWAPHVREALWCLLRKDYKILYGDRFPLFLGCSGLITIVSRDHEVLASSLSPFRVTRGSERLVRKGSLHTSVLWRGFRIDIQNVHTFSPKLGSAMKLPSLADSIIGRDKKSEDFVREIQLRGIEDRMNDSYRGADLVIAAGDFNLITDRAKLHKVASDLFKLRLPNPQNFAENAGNTWIAGKLRTKGGIPFDCRLDRGYILPPSQAMPPLAVDAEVLYDWEWSDHFPVRFTFEMLHSTRAGKQNSL